MPTPQRTNSDVQDRVTEYWDMRARGYSLATRLSLRDSSNMMDEISRMINLSNRMRVADMGCSAGLMSMIFARLGHDVTGLDLSENMIRQARRNARDLGLSIDFRVADVQDPPLPEASFDLIIAKSVIWCTVDPVRAYSRWMDILKPGGCLLVIDGNHYLDLYDEEYRRRKEYFDLKNGVDNNLHAWTNLDGVDLNIIRDLARELPLTSVRRPTWDLSILLGLGMTDIRVMSTDPHPYSVLNENGLMKLPKNFIILARRPWEDTGVKRERGPWRLEGDSALDIVRESMGDPWTDQLTIMKALSNETRLNIVHALMNGRMSVGQIVSVLGASQSLVSHSLRVLREAGIVEAVRDGKEIVYGLTDVNAMRAIMSLCGTLVPKGDGDVPPDAPCSRSQHRIPSVQPPEVRHPPGHGPHREHSDRNPYRRAGDDVRGPVHAQVHPGDPHHRRICHRDAPDPRIVQQHRRRPGEGRGRVARREGPGVRRRNDEFKVHDIEGALPAHQRLEDDVHNDIR